MLHPASEMPSKSSLDKVMPWCSSIREFLMIFSVDENENMWDSPWLPQPAKPIVSYTGDKGIETGKPHISHIS